MNEMDIIAQRKYAHKTGFAEGRTERIAEGMAEGEMSKARDVAEKMLVAGFPAETIISCTGLDWNELGEIASGRQ